MIRSENTQICGMRLYCGSLLQRQNNYDMSSEERSTCLYFEYILRWCVRIPSSERLPLYVSFLLDFCGSLEKPFASLRVYAIFCSCSGMHIVIRYRVVIDSQCWFVEDVVLNQAALCTRRCMCKTLFPTRCCLLQDVIFFIQTNECNHQVKINHACVCTPIRQRHIRLQM